LNTDAVAKFKIPDCGIRSTPAYRGSSSLSETGNNNDLLGVIVSYSIKV
jgi:hypothetical protein